MRGGAFNDGVDLSLCWDGATEMGEVRVNGIVLTAKGSDAERAFHVLQALRDRVWDAEARLEVARVFVARLQREVGQ